MGHMTLRKHLKKATAMSRGPGHIQRTILAMMESNPEGAWNTSYLIDQVYPAYNFGRNKGYATRDHLDRLLKHGPCVYHRRSWLAVHRYMRPQGRDLEAADAAR